MYVIITHIYIRDEAEIRRHCGGLDDEATDATHFDNHQKSSDGGRMRAARWPAHDALQITIAHIIYINNITIM